MNTFNTTFFTILQLVKRDLYIFKQHLPTKIRLTLTWCAVNLTIAQVCMPQMGLSNFGPITLVSIGIVNGFFLVMMNAIMLVSDIQGNKTISYELTLPVSHTMIFIKYALSNAIESLLISSIIIPFGKLMFYNSIFFKDLSLIKVTIIFILANLFFGFFSLCLASMVKNVYKSENIWIRFIFPLWFLGCYQFSWKTLHTIMPMAAYINLLNPLTYITEGARAATIDTAGSLPFWYCCIALMLCTYIVGHLGIYRMKQRLDCI